MNWYQPAQNGFRLRLHLQPGAKRNQVVGLYGDALKIALSNPPVDGKANAALIAFLSAQLHIPKQRITLLSGHLARKKIVVIQGVTEIQLRQLLPQS